MNMIMLNAYLMSKEHIIYNFLINDRGLIHQGINFPSGSTFLNPFKQEDEAIDRTENVFDRVHWETIDYWLFSKRDYYYL